MPWKAKSPMDLRRDFIKRLAANERLTDLCREYGISRKTGSKFKRRFDELGAVGLADQSRAPNIGGLRRATVRGHVNVAKRALVQVAAFNLGLRRRERPVRARPPEVRFHHGLLGTSRRTRHATGRSVAKKSFGCRDSEDLDGLAEDQNLRPFAVGPHQGRPKESARVSATKPCRPCLPLGSSTRARAVR